MTIDKEKLFPVLKDRRKDNILFVTLILLMIGIGIKALIVKPLTMADVTQHMQYYEHTITNHVSNHVDNQLRTIEQFEKRLNDLDVRLNKTNHMFNNHWHEGLKRPVRFE